MSVKFHRITSAGQVSLPAEVRRRWATDQVVLVDHGDHLVVRPAPEDPIAALRGIWRDRGISSKELREIARRDEEIALSRRERAARRR